MDLKILYLINDLHCSVLDNFMVFITHLGDSGFIWIITALILLCFKKTRKLGILILITLITSLILGNGILKNIIRRSRPCWIDKSIPLLIENPTDYSFPSGHTLASFASAVMIFLHNKKWGIVSLIGAFLIAVSRLYLFVHFPTDILAGAFLGAFISLGIYYIYQKKFVNKK